MGSAFSHLCPTASIKLITSRQFRRSVSHVRGDTTALCISDTDVFVEQTCSKTLENRSNNECSNRTALLKTVSTVIRDSKIVKEYVNFPFLTDNEIASWIINARFMFILRGPPGSGKSYLCECIRIRFPGAKVCSADEFFYIESHGVEYQFDINRLSEAHNYCHDKAYNVAESGASPLIIDNTNIRAWETRYYTDLARRFGYNVIMVIPQTPWRFDTEALSMRNIHFVGIETIESKVRNFEYVFPLYYGWVWPSATSNKTIQSDSTNISNLNNVTPAIGPFADTNRLLNFGWDSLTLILDLPDVRIQMASDFGLSDDVSVTEIVRHWRSATLPPFGCGLDSVEMPAAPHITAMYARFGRAPGAQHYGLSGAVTDSLLGKLFTIQVTGLFISARTVGIRVRLPSDDLVLHHLWASDDQAVLPRDCAFSHGSDNVDSIRRPVGCRAHVSLALASDVSAVETGLDLLRIVDAELAQLPGEHLAIIPGGSVRRVTVAKPPVSPTRCVSSHYTTAPPGHEYMYVLDLDTPQHYRVLFTAVY